MTGGQWDAIVAGGGPAGCACAIELAQRGRRVLVLDAEPAPRYAIGESLSPVAGTILRSYGVDFGSMGFVAKPGATFAWSARAPFATYYPDATAWQVRRAELDAMLLDRAREAGATVRSGQQVTEVLFEGDRAAGVKAAAADGKPIEERGRWVVDATGRAAIVARRLGVHRADPAQARHAIWAYWSGARPLPDRAAGNSLFLGGRPAWWYLPVDSRTGLVGVGLMADGADVPQNAEEHYLSALADVPILSELLAGALRAGPVRSESVGAYHVDRVAGPGWISVGDAAGFVDPVLTPGVQLALQYGQQAAAAIHASLTDPGHWAGLAAEYSRRVTRQLASFRRLAANLFSASGFRPPEVLVSDLVGGDEQFDRATFLSLISGLAPDRLRAQLGGYLGMRAAAIRYGGTAPVFSETEGFAFLSWTLSRDGTPAAATSGRRLRLTQGTKVRTLLLPTSEVDSPRRIRALETANGDRYLVTPELEALLGILTDGPDADEARRRFSERSGSAGPPGAFDRWIDLLTRHAVVQRASGTEARA